MKKTNLRLNNFFVFQKDEKYYLTDIDVLDDWKKIDNKKLNDFIKDTDITDKLKELIKSYGINANINFILSDFKKYKKSLEKGENKVISLKKGGYKQE
jgi:ssDNA-specific exonuclease RecJ